MTFRSWGFRAADADERWPTFARSTLAAARLGMPRSTLESKIRSPKLDEHRFKKGVESYCGAPRVLQAHTVTRSPEMPRVHRDVANARRTDPVAQPVQP